MAKIEYDTELNGTIGFLKVDPDPAPPRKDLDGKNEDRRTLLHALFSLGYTKLGRETHIKWVRVTAANEQGIRKELDRVLREVYGLTDEKSPAEKPQRNKLLREAFVDAHIAASRFVEPFQDIRDKQVVKSRVNRSQLTPQEEIAIQKHELTYEQNVTFVMQCLVEDAMKHEFSMAW